MLLHYKIFVQMDVFFFFTLNRKDNSLLFSKISMLSLSKLLLTARAMPPEFLNILDLCLAKTVTPGITIVSRLSVGVSVKKRIENNLQIL